MNIEVVKLGNKGEKLILQHLVNRQCFTFVGRLENGVTKK